MPVTGTAARPQAAGRRGRGIAGVPLLVVVLSVAALVAMLAAGCGSRASGEPPANERASTPAADTSTGPDATGSDSTITVTSSAFPQGGRIPARFTCDGAGAAPPLSWSGAPGRARSIAVVVDDPDAPGGTYTHWVVAALPPTATAMADPPPAGAVQARNSAGGVGYTPPCPPDGPAHHYRFTVLALDLTRPFADGAVTADALTAIDAHAIARGTLVGRYARS